MKTLATLLALVGVGLFATGCNNPQGQESKEKFNEVGGELLKTGKKAGEAIESGLESLAKEGKEATKSAADATSKALEGEKGSEQK